MDRASGFEPEGWGFESLRAQFLVFLTEVVSTIGEWFWTL